MKSLMMKMPYLRRTKRYVRRRKYKRPSPIKIHNVNSTEEDIGTKTGVQKRPNVNHDKSPTLEPQKMLLRRRKRCASPFKPLYPRGRCRPKFRVSYVAQAIAVTTKGVRWPPHRMLAPLSHPQAVTLVFCESN